MPVLHRHEQTRGAQIVSVEELLGGASLHDVDAVNQSTDPVRYETRPHQASVRLPGMLAKKSTEELHNREAVLVHELVPILSVDAVTEQLGSAMAERLGALKAVIELPTPMSWFDDYERSERKPNPIYVFQQNPEGKHGQPSYQLLTEQQLTNLQTSLERGRPESEETESSIISLQPGENFMLGRHSWVPDVGADTDLLNKDPALRHRNLTISRQHAEIFVDDEGLHIKDMSHNGTFVKHMGPAPDRPDILPLTKHW